ncbi:MAG: hypothetical protein ACPGUD_10830 [Parashewanella sp.]
MNKIEKIIRFLMFVIGIVGGASMLLGNIFLLYNGISPDPLSWLLLPCPLLCLYFALSTSQREQLLSFFKKGAFFKA